MKRLVLALAVVVGAFASTSSWAATIATVPVVGSPFSDEQKGHDASGNIDYTFTLGALSQISVNSSGPLAGFSGTDTTGLSGLSLVLLDSTNTTIASAASVALFGQRITGLTDILAAGSYTLQIFFTKAASKTLFDVTTTVTTNLVAATPIPTTGLLLLTAVGGLGGLAFRRKRADTAA
jgi:hypothetical protein